MALATTCSKIIQSADGRIHIGWSDGTEMEFPSKANAITWASGGDVKTDEALTILRRLLLAWWLKGDPTGATPATVVNKTITIDLTLLNLVVVT